MTFWITCVGVLAAAMALLLAASRHGQQSKTDPSLAVYRDQLAELERDAAAGKVPESEAKAMRTEIARRLLAVDDRKSQPVPAGSRFLPLAFALLLPVIAIPGYLMAGKPGVPDTPLADRLGNAVANNDMAAMIAQIERQLAAKPDDMKGWSILAPTYLQLGRFADAAHAYAQVIRLSPPSAQIHADRGETLVFAGEGLVSAVALAEFETALSLDAANPKARYYVALGLKQSGKLDDARASYEALLADAPADAPWKATVEQEIASLSRAPALSQEQIAAGQQMADGDRQAMIRTMVDGLESKLAADGADFDGWLKLIRARTVLGEEARAREALAKAGETFRGQPQRLSSLEALAKELNLQ
jgi:cytochrome c-type biogenesis protein CcmH